MDDEHIFALVETINGAHLDAIHQLALDAAFIDDIGQMSFSFRGSLSGFHQGGMFHRFLYQVTVKMQFRDPG